MALPRTVTRRCWQERLLLPSLDKDELLQPDLRKPPSKEQTMISLVSASTATPQNRFSSTELVASMMHKLSPELINTICTLGVDQRYSTMDNYADFLNGAPMNPTSSTTEPGVNATRRCIEEW